MWRWITHLHVAAERDVPMFQTRSIETSSSALNRPTFDESCWVKSAISST
jgi:hypothetical protein